MSKSLQEIVDFFEQHVDTTGWIEKSVSFVDRYSISIEIKYGHADTREWKLMSRDAFATLDSVAIYELEPRKESLRIKRPWYQRLFAWT